MSSDKKSEVGQTAGTHEVDIYRDTPVRLLGYANELGEAFRVWVTPFWVRASYGVASAYVVADTYDKGSKAAKVVPGRFVLERPHYDNLGTIGLEESAGQPGQQGHVLRVSVDTLVWQALASVMVPGFTINRVCAGTLLALGRTRLPVAARKRLTTAAGLAVIPFIVTPIDRLVDWTLDRSLRRLLGIGPQERQHPHPSH